MNTTTIAEHFEDIGEPELALIIKRTDVKPTERLRCLMQKQLGELDEGGIPTDPLIDLPMNGLVLVDNEQHWCLLRDGAVIVAAYGDQAGLHLWFPLARIGYREEHTTQGQLVVGGTAFTQTANNMATDYGWLELARLEGVVDPYNTLEQLAEAGEI